MTPQPTTLSSKSKMLSQKDDKPYHSSL